MAFPAEPQPRSIEHGCRMLYWIVGKRKHAAIEGKA
jgi:hypothetical protein